MSGGFIVPYYFRMYLTRGVVSKSKHKDHFNKLMDNNFNIKLTERDLRENFLLDNLTRGQIKKLVKYIKAGKDIMEWKYVEELEEGQLATLLLFALRTGK